MSDFISVQHDQHIYTISIDRPNAKNALNIEMYTSLANILIEANNDDSVRAILLTHTNEVFCSGNDMHDFLHMSQGTLNNSDSRQQVERFMVALLNCRKPIVAAVNGAAIGIGTTLLQYCDFVFCSPHTRFQTPFTPLGLCPEFASSIQLEKIIGTRKAKAMLMMGEPMMASEAESLGFVNQVVDSPFNKAQTYVKQLASLPPNAMRNTKALLNASSIEPLLAGIEIENQLLFDLLAQPEAKEAISAFLEKRAPDFSQF